MRAIGLLKAGRMSLKSIPCLPILLVRFVSSHAKWEKSGSKISNWRAGIYASLAFQMSLPIEYKLYIQMYFISSHPQASDPASFFAGEGWTILKA